MAGNGKSLPESTDTNKQKIQRQRQRKIKAPSGKKKTRSESTDLFQLECFVIILDSLVVTDKALFGIKAGKWGNYTA